MSNLVENNRVGVLRRELVSRLKPSLGEREAVNVTRLLFENVMGWKPVDLVFKSDYELEPATVNTLNDMARRVEAGEPVQYVTGKAQFEGLTFKVGPGVLVPRPETAELVDMIVKEWAGQSDLSILDCGTGSGSIAISLARALPFVRVTAIDIDDKALSIAAENISRLKVRVNLEKKDILTLPEAEGEVLDIIVSNPPYVLDSERSEMDTNVIDHEPHIALFVPDTDPLKFYRPIALFAGRALRPGGKLYFEINPLCVNEMRLLLKDFDNVTVTRDAQGRERFIEATQPR